MANELTIFDQPQLAIPDYMKDVFETEGNVGSGISVPSLAYKGKVWSITLEGETRTLTKRDDEGDEVPVQVMRLVVLDFAKRRGRAYYAGSYNPDKTSAPACWSSNGVEPDASVPEPVHAKCATCPMNEVGSRTTDDGRSVKACGTHRMLAVVPANKMDMPPLRLKIAVTSDYDASRDTTDNWFAWQQLRKWMSSKIINHTVSLVLKVKFDPNEAYPKLLFQPDRWTTQEEFALLFEKSKDPSIEMLIGAEYTPDGTEGKAVVHDESDEDEADEEMIQPPKEKKAVPKAPTKAKAPVENVDEDEDEDEDDTPPLKKEAKSGKKSEAKDVPDDLADILAEWDD